MNSMQPRKPSCYNCKGNHYFEEKCPWDFCIFCWTQLIPRKFHACDRSWVKRLPEFNSNGEYRRFFAERIDKRQSWNRLRMCFDHFRRSAHLQRMGYLTYTTSGSRNQSNTEKSDAVTADKKATRERDGYRREGERYHHQRPQEHHETPLQEFSHIRQDPALFEPIEKENDKKVTDSATQTEHITYKSDTKVPEKPTEFDDTGEIQVCSPREIYQAPVKGSILGSLRRSSRLKQKGNPVAEVVKDYDECAAQIPDVKDETEVTDDLNRDAVVSNPEDYKLLEESKIHNYISACERKFFGDKHNALTHLAASDYSIKHALETIDSSDSLPMIYIHENFGIWSNEEIVSFINMISNDYQWDANEKKRTKNPLWIEKFRESFPNKSRKNCLNLYYTLKRAGFSFQTRSFEDPAKFLSTSSNNQCVNCINQLWKLANQERYVSNLCSLCQLYTKLYGKQRPNAKALPFDLSILCLKEN